MESGGICFKRDFQHAQKEMGIKKKIGKIRGEKTQPRRRMSLRVEKTHSWNPPLPATRKVKKCDQNRAQMGKSK